MPAIGFGTATMFNDDCIKAVRSAIKLGYRYIDTALLYNNQEAVGKAIKAAIAEGDVTRAELFVTSKVAFYPEDSNGKNCTIHLSHHPENRKGYATTASAVDLCLSLLGLDYVDLMLIHNPCTNPTQYEASTVTHAFELSKNTYLTGEERDMILAHRLKATHAVWDLAKDQAARAASWKALEEAQAAGKCRAIGVSNYPKALVEEMEGYAKVQAAVNQLEFHPRFASPALLAHAKAMGMVLTAYGTGNSVVMPPLCPVITAMAAAKGVPPVVLVAKWTLQKGVGIIPRSSNPVNQKANLEAGAGVTLSEQDMASLDALNKAHPYYWWPMPLLPEGAKPDM